MSLIERILPPLPRAGKPKMRDILVPILMLSVLLGFGSYEYVTQTSQVRDDDKRLRALREQGATLQQQYAEINSATSERASELATPHPSLEDRDLDVTGEHTNVSWTYAPADNEKPSEANTVAYMLQLTKVKALGPCDPGGAAKNDFLSCRTGWLRSFMATENKLQDKEHTSRVPPFDGTTLAPGTYAWRVRAVPFGTVVLSSVSDTAHLSDWSGYGSFTIYGSLTERLQANKRVRVGTNLEQNTRFARLGPGGPYGFDISLIHDLVEGCMELRDDGPVFNGSGACHQYLEAQIAQLKAPAAPPKREPDELPESGPPRVPRACDSNSEDSQQRVLTPAARGASCLSVDFVPIRKWVQWREALRRKDIDVFVGGVTAADAREGSGIRFTNGYLSFKSHLFIHAGDVFPDKLLRNWLIHDRAIGVIDDSSNQALLAEIIKAHNPAGSQWKIVPRTFASFPGVEAAMDRGEIDGAIVDDTFVVGHDEWKLVKLDQIAGMAWRNYLSHFVGEHRGGEYISAAVAIDDDKKCGAAGSATDLFCALNDAVSDTFVRNVYRRDLCGVFWSADQTSLYRCEELP